MYKKLSNTNVTFLRMRRSALEHQAAVRDQMELASIYTATSHLSAVSTIGQRVQSLEYTLASIYAANSHLSAFSTILYRSESTNKVHIVLDFFFTLLWIIWYVH